MIIKKCMKCGATVSVIDDCDISCCDEIMKELKSNTIHVRVNHEMIDEHYIERIFLESDESIIEIKFKPGDSPIVDLPYIKNSTLYSLCNKHNLWSIEVK